MIKNHSTSPLACKQFFQENLLLVNTSFKAIFNKSLMAWGLKDAMSII